MTFRNIAIIGAGAMGTALAINLARKSRVRLIFRDRATMEAVRETRANEKALPGFLLPAEVACESEVETGMKDADLVLICTPVQAFASVLDQLRDVAQEIPVLWCCKGLSPIDGKPLSETAAQVLGDTATFGVLSGPSFAHGLAAGEPTALVCSTNKGRETNLAISASLSNESLRVYSNSDLAGVQICGALKNIYAIAAGVIDGCGWQENTRAAMITRAVAESARFLAAHHGALATLMGLSGFGDLYLTCGSRASRNYQVGMGLAAGKTLEETLALLGHVAEGVHAARLVHSRAREIGVEMPLVESVFDVLEGRKTPRECVLSLMTREVRHECGNVATASNSQA